jgi:hypothetical protein
MSTYFAAVCLCLHTPYLFLHAFLLLPPSSPPRHARQTALTHALTQEDPEPMQADAVRLIQQICQGSKKATRGGRGGRKVREKAVRKAPLCFFLRFY